MTTGSRNTVTGSGLDGAWLLDDYEPIKTIGRGSYATAYLCRMRQRSGRAVVKVTHPDLIRGGHAETLRRRFSAEVRSLAALEHPNLVRIHRAGITPSGLPAIAMDYIEGPTLEQHLCHGPVMDSAEVVSLLGQLASALRCVHEHGIVHRDVSPQNIVWHTSQDGVGRPVLLDFGVAAFRAEGDSQTVVGTPRYIAPERLYAPATDLSDMYSVGAVGWWAFTGRPHGDDAPDGSRVVRRDLLSRVVVEPMIRSLLDPDPRRRMTARAVERRAAVTLDGPVGFRPAPRPRVAVIDQNPVTCTAVQSLCRSAGADPVAFDTCAAFFSRRCRRPFDVVLLVGELPDNPVMLRALSGAAVHVVFGRAAHMGSDQHTLVLPAERSVLVEDLQARLRTPAGWVRRIDAWMDAWACVLDSPAERCNHCVAEAGALSERESVAGSKEPPRLSRLLSALFEQGDQRATSGLLQELRNACELAIGHQLKEMANDDQ